MMSSWQPKQAPLMTPFAADVDPTRPWPEYPRPQLVRDRWHNLNGLWQYAIMDWEAERPAKFPHQILVPFAIESALSGVMQPLQPDERLWYRRTFTVDSGWHGQRVLLHFGAVDWACVVWVNNQNVGDHRGGYVPFTFDITDAIHRDDESEIIVAVWDPTDTGMQERGKQVLDPHMIWYTAVSGIWQTVWLEPVPRTYIKRINLTPDIDREQVMITSELAGDGAAEPGVWTLAAEALDGDQQVALAEGSPADPLRLTIPDPHLWSPNVPHLYDLRLALRQGDTVVDEVQSTFGMRTFTIEPDANGIARLCLNHQPLFQYGPLDQGYWPDSLYTPPTEEAMLYDLEVIKDLGFNMVRKHIKMEPARWYAACDRLGLIVWQDMPNGGKMPPQWLNLLAFLFNVHHRDKPYKMFGREDPDFRQQYRAELKEMVDALHPFPCIGVWVPFNEAWGQFDTAEVTTWLKDYDPSRLVDATSGWFDMGVGDFASRHKYVGPLMPDTGSARAAALTEFGGLGLLIKEHAWQLKKLWSYQRARTSGKLTDNYIKLMQKLKPMIAQGLSAAIYTQITDVEMEVNGLLTYDRKRHKMDRERVIAAHRELLGEEHSNE